MTCSVVLRFPQLQSPVVTTPNIQYSFKNWYLTPSLFVMLTCLSLSSRLPNEFLCLRASLPPHFSYPLPRPHPGPFVTSHSTFDNYESDTLLSKYHLPSSSSLQFLHLFVLLTSPPVFFSLSKTTPVVTPFCIQPRLHSPTLESLAGQSFCYLASLSFQWSPMTMAEP